MPSKTDFALVMAKHLPPSAADLRLLDVGGVVGADLQQRRPDISLEIASLNPQHWQYPSQSVDAVVAYDILLKSDLLASILEVMRAGGRFIMVNPLGTVDETIVRMLEKAGYVRILVETAHNGEGVLIRGEKAHATDDTLKRVQTIADRDANLLDVNSYRGRYVHLLIVQTPNKPVWKLLPDEPIHWRAAAIQHDDKTTLLAFSSLPKAVSFMQPAVIDGFIQDVNKVGKFSKATAQAWQHAVLLNPTLASVRDYPLQWVAMNVDTAEAPDE